VSQTMKRVRRFRAPDAEAATTFHVSRFPDGDVLDVTTPPPRLVDRAPAPARLQAPLADSVRRTSYIFTI